MGSPIKLLVVQDRAVVRAGLAALIRKESDLDLVGEAGAGSEALRLVRNHQPDVVIMDLRSSTMDDLEAPKAVREACSSTRILMLTDDDECGVFAALSAEADGYCLREAEFERIHSAITCVASGEFWLDSSIARKVVKTLLDTIAILGSEPQDRAAGPDIDALSPRELEVLSLVAQGLSNQKIAERLGISSETVKSHIRHIMKKLVVNDRTQAAVKALKRGLI
jgi:DNA-binding NarL/FixJ family response regulator